MNNAGYIKPRESSHPSELIIKAYNKFDFHSQKSFFDILSQKKYAAYTIDLTEASYIDSIALGMLLVLHHMVHQDGCTIRIIGCCDAILHILHIAHFERFFEIEGISDMASP